MKEVLAYSVRIIIDVICMAHCFRAKKPLSNLSAYMILLKAVGDYKIMERSLGHYLQKTELTKTTNKVIKSKKVKMGFDLSA